MQGFSGMMWPSSVWEMGVYAKDKQLWYKRAVTPVDVSRRKDYEHEYFKRHPQREVT